MTFVNEKKTFLAKLDKSKKGSLDLKVLSLINTINSKSNYYTTSSCSGRVVFWQGSGKKNETVWLKVSHDLIDLDFFDLENQSLSSQSISSSQPSQLSFSDLIWLRLEPFIIHIACLDLESANKLLNLAKLHYKKSSLLSINNKIIVEIRGSESIEMPFSHIPHQTVNQTLNKNQPEHALLFSGDLEFLKEIINQKLTKIWLQTEKFNSAIFQQL